MITDKISNIDLYKNISNRLAKGLDLLKDPALLTRTDGKYEVDGTNLFYLVQRYKTKKVKDAKFEAHKNYIDIQAILRGKEIIGYAHINGLKVSVPYKEDVLFFETPEQYTELKLSESMFAVLFPEDAHMPLCDFGGQNDVVKIVVKVKI